MAPCDHHPQSTWRAETGSSQIPSRHDHANAHSFLGRGEVSSPYFMEEEAEGKREEGAFFESQTKNLCQSQITIQGPMFNWPTVPWTQTTGPCLGKRGPSEGRSSLQGCLPPWHPLGSLCDLLLCNFITFLLIHPLQPQHICSSCRSPAGRCAYLHSCEGFPQSCSLTT